jgi:hypothetical protein
MSEGGTFSLCANDSEVWIYQSSFSDSFAWRAAASVIEEAAAKALGAKPSRGGRGSTRWTLPGVHPVRLGAVLDFCRQALAGLRAAGLAPDFALAAPDIADWPSAAYVEDIPEHQARAMVIRDGYNMLVEIRDLLVVDKEAADKAMTPKAVTIEPAEPDDPALAGLSEELDAAASPEPVAERGLVAIIDRLRSELEENQISDAEAAMKLAEAVIKRGATFRRSVFEQMVSGIRRGS